jgi:predicted TIM-barrel enzyme
MILDFFGDRTKAVASVTHIGANAAEVLKMMGCIIGARLAYDGISWNAVGQTGVAEFMDKVKSLR